MAPGYRNQNRRQNRTGYVDHDVFEGLPVRQWRRDYTTVVPAPAQEPVGVNDIWAVELPHGMPKDSHLLPQHSQDLLRAARSGKIYKRPAPVEEEEADVEAILGEKTEKKDDDLKDRGWTAKTWKPVPRHLEGPDLEYLAKRRKGLITVAAKLINAGPTLTKATVKRIDAAGNEYVQDVIVSQGQKVEGDVISQTQIPDPSANPITDGVLAPTPQKRKGPPRKKHHLKGIGRGRKKKPIAPTSVPQEELALDGVARSGEEIDGTDGVGKAEDGTIKNETTNTPAAIEDTEMAEGSTHDSDDEDGEDGEDGDDDDEGSVENQSSPSKLPPPLSSPPSSLPVATEILNIPLSGIENESTEATARPPILHLEREKLELKAGSPLKNVAMTTSTLTSPLESPSTSTAPPFPESAPLTELNPIPEVEEPARIDETIQQVTETASTEPQSLSSEVTLVEEVASTEVLHEEDEMLFDIVENANNATIGGDQSLSAVGSETPVERPRATLESVLLDVDRVPEEQEEGPFDSAVVEDVQGEQSEPMEEEDDDFPDLLGGLEKQLNEQVSHAPSVEHIPEVIVEKTTENAASDEDKR